MLEDFCKAMGMVLPTGKDAYLTAQAQYDWMKTALSIPAVAYGDIMRLMEAWIIGVPATEVCCFIIAINPAEKGRPISNRHKTCLFA